MRQGFNINMVDKNILIVEDEKSIRDMIQFAFMNTNFILAETANVTQAREVIYNKNMDLILIDWMLPGKNGIELVKELKSDSQTKKIPIIMLTARSEEKDKIQGLNAGVDDYVVKPFSPRELLARINAVLRRSGYLETPLLQVGELKMHQEFHQVTCGNIEVHLGPLEYKLLNFFMAHSDKVFSRSQLISRVWGGNIIIDERTVDVHIRRLRKNLQKVNYDNLIQTVRGFGYRLSTHR